MYTLYYSPGACSLAVHALLHSLPVPFETMCVDITKGENRRPDFLKLNPRGQVPVLMEDGRILRESAAIAVHLAQKHASPLLPQEEYKQLEALEWLGFYNSTLQQAYSAYFLLSANLKEEGVRDAACALAAKRIGHLWREVEAHLADREYLCGPTLTLADLFHAVIANWTGVLHHKVALGPNILRLCAKMATLPYFRKALAAENIHYGLEA
jgi:glutathione S-transferase